MPLEDTASHILILPSSAKQSVIAAGEGHPVRWIILDVVPRYDDAVALFLEHNYLQMVFSIAK